MPAAPSLCQDPRGGAAPANPRARGPFHLGGGADGAEVAELELDEAAQPAADGDDGIDAPRVAHGLGMASAPEGHGVEREPSDGHFAPQVVGVRADLAN